MMEPKVEPWYENGKRIGDKLFIGNLVEQEVFVPLIEAMVACIEELSANKPTPITTLSTRSTTEPSSLASLQNLTSAMCERYKPNIEGESNAQ